MSKRRNTKRFQQFADGIINPVQRLGDFTPNTFSATRYAPGFKTFNRQQLEWMYQTSWLCGLAVDIIAEDMTREGLAIKGTSPEIADRIDAAFDDFGIWGTITDAIKWSRLYGGSLAVMLIDGDDMEQPLDVKSIEKGAFRGLFPLDRWQVRPSSNLVQKLGRDFGKPESYEVLPGISGLQIPDRNVHYTRVLRFDGVTMPFFLRQAYQGWGASILERVDSRIKAFDSATQSAAQLLSKVYLRYYKVKGLREILSNELASKGFRRQMDVVREMQSIEGMTLGDASDDFQVFNYSFQGLPDVLLQFGQQVSGAIGVPLVRLFGQSPVGFNSTGESDLRLYYDDVRRKQDSDLRHNMKRLLRVMYQSLFGDLPDSEFSFEFRPLWQLTEETKATTAQTTTGAILQAYDSQLIGAGRALEELKKQAEVTGVFSTVTAEDIDKAEEADEMEPPAMAGMNGEIPAGPVAQVPANPAEQTDRGLVQAAAAKGLGPNSANRLATENRGESGRDSRQSANQPVLLRRDADRLGSGHGPEISRQGKPGRL